MLHPIRKAKKEQLDPHEIHEKILSAARRSGVISLNNRGLCYVPPVIWSLNKFSSDKSPINFASANDDDIKWWEAEPITRLSLFGNSIKDLPGNGIMQLDSLENVDVRDNQLAGLPEEIGELKNLKQLLLKLFTQNGEIFDTTELHAHLRLIATNRIVTLPETFTQLAALVMLDLAHNCLTALPNDLAKLTALELLDVSDNQLSQAPPTLPPKLNILNLSRNRLVRLPPGWIQSCLSLREFNASYNDLEDVGITENPVLPRLATFILQKNRLSTIPLLSVFPHLKEVALGENRIDCFDLQAFQGLHDLSVLELSHNRIPSVPNDIPTTLPALTRLDLSANDIKNIPTELGFMETLNFLSLSGNPLRTLGQQVINSRTEALKAVLRERHQSSANCPTPREKTSSAAPSEGVGELPTNSHDHLPVVARGSGLLDWGLRLKKQTGGRQLGGLQSDDKVELPPLDDPEAWMAAAFKGYECDIAVKILVLTNRQLVTYPTGIVAFRDTLTVLNLSHNNLSQLPNDIDCLSRLEELNLSNNALTALPANLAKLSALATLTLNCNPGLGPELPSGILLVEPLCRSLRELSARGCRLTRLPPASAMSVDRMPRLQSLDVSDNDISRLEPELGLCTQIQNLQITGNSFRIPRSAIVAKGTTAILEYLRSRIVG